MKILFSAYACEPGMGSEPGVGWNVPATIAAKYKEMQIFVLTRSRSREKIDIAIRQQNLRNLHVMYYDIPKALYYEKEYGSRWGEQYNYVLWQILVRRYVRRIVKEYEIDIFHHLTFNQYRTPSPGFYLDIPFVYGPVGGAETINPSFDRDLASHTQQKEKIRRKGYDLRLFKWWIGRRNNPKVFLFSTQENYRKMKPYCKGHEAEVLPAIGFSPKDIPQIGEPEKTDTFEMIYAGRALDWKGVKLFLNAADMVFHKEGIKNFKIKLIGIRFEAEQKAVRSWVTRGRLENNVEIIPFMERDKLIGLLAKASLSVYPAFRDSGSMSVLEASALGCPTICFDAGGQDAFPDEALMKIRVTDSYDENLRGFASKLLWAYRHPDELKAIGQNARAYVYNHLTWEKKVEHYMEIYQNLLEKRV